MTASTTKINELKRLEAQLSKQQDPRQRMLLLDQLAGHYTFTNIKKAQSLLSEQINLLRQHANPDLQLNYHLNTAFVENQLYNYILAEIHFKEAIEIIEERGDVKQQAEVYIDYAGTAINLDKMELATRNLDKAIKLLEAFPDKKLMVRAIAREGFLNLHYSNYTKATELFLKAEKDLSGTEREMTLKDHYFHSLICSGLGRVYERNDDFVKSVRWYLKVVTMCEHLGMRSRLSWHYLNVGNAYLALQDADGAETFFRKAIGTKDDISLYARASAYANLGFLYFTKRHYDEALKLYNHADKLYREKSNDDYFNFSVIENWRGKLYAALDRRKKAQRHFLKAMDYANKINDKKQLSSISKEIAAFFAEIGDFENAYSYQLMHNDYADRYMEEVNQRMLMELEVKYEAEKKKQEAELLRLQATGLQLKALRAQMNPHFMYNALNSIQNYITSNEAASAAKYLSKFAKLMRQSLNYSDMEIISLEEEIDFLGDYLFINKKLRFDDKLEYQIKVDDEIEEDIMGVPTMIVQPYVENAIEHGLRSKMSGLVKLIFELQDDHTILCIVEDDGIGRKKAKELRDKDPLTINHRSMGTSITEQRLEILHRTRRKGVFVKTIDLKKGKKAKGTRVEIQIPIEIIQKKQLVE